MKKIILINIISIILILFLAELSIWTIKNIELEKDNVGLDSWLPFRPHFYEKEFNLTPYNFPSPEHNWGRAPDGLEYKKSPVVLFGCSFTYGMYLSQEQTLSYKLANLTKRPIYNRGCIGWGIQHMVLQTSFDELYKQIPEPEQVIFTFINDHIRRLFVLSISSYDFLTQDQYLRYKEKDNKLTQIKRKNKINSFLKASYIVREIHKQYVQKHILKNENLNNCYSFAIKHFQVAKEQMQKHWKNTKYVVILYDSENEFLISELEKIGYTVITTKELTSENLQTPKYLYSKHPTEEAWDLLTPLIAEKLNLK